MYKSTNLMLTAKCMQCGAIYYAEIIIGGSPIDEDSTQTIYDAEKKGDRVELVPSDSGIRMSKCNCK